MPAAVVAAALALGACGGGPSTTGTTGSPSPGSTSSHTSNAPGHITDVLSSLATVNGTRAASGDPLPAGGVLATTDAGIATFAIGKKLSDCQIEPGSSLTVSPLTGQTLSFQQGTALCSSAPGGTDTITLGVPNGTIQFQDPIFVVTVQGATTLVAVNRGFVKLQPTDGGATTARLIGPGEQATLTRAAAAPSAVQLFNPQVLDPSSQRAIQRMQAATAPDNLGFPDPGTSTVLSRIRAAGTVVVALDPSATPQVTTFAQSYLAFLKSQWGVGTTLDAVSPADAATLLSRGTVDVVLSPANVPASSSVPFFTDAQGRVWSLSTPPSDTRFAAELQTFVGTSYTSGAFGLRYAVAFQRPVTYEPLRRLTLPPALLLPNATSP